MIMHHRPRTAAAPTRIATRPSWVNSQRATLRRTESWNQRLTSAATMTKTIFVQKTGLVSSRTGSPIVIPRPVTSRVRSPHQIHGR